MIIRQVITDFQLHVINNDGVWIASLSRDCTQQDRQLIPALTTEFSYSEYIGWFCERCDSLKKKCYCGSLDHMVFTL